MVAKADVNIRQATSADLDNIASLHAKSWQENYAQVLSADYLNNKVLAERMRLWTTRLNSPSAKQCVFVAEVNHEFVGFICMFGANHKTYGTIIDNLHVKAHYKGYGLGRLLINTAAKWANQHYAALPLYLEVLACNTNAMGFYSSLGASNVATAYWHTPCNNQAQEFVYCWPSAERLMTESSAR